MNDNDIQAKSLNNFFIYTATLADPVTFLWWNRNFRASSSHSRDRVISNNTAGYSIF